MPLFTRKFVSCHVNPDEPHLYNDPVMLLCSHVFCRSCCLHLAKTSNDQSITCPICATRIPFDDLARFSMNLISHGTLAAMVEQYRREENSSRMCVSCQMGSIDADDCSIVCHKCHEQNELIKKKISRRIATCDQFLARGSNDFLEKIQIESNNVQTTINERALELVQQVDNYQKELDGLLDAQQTANEINAQKHQTIDIDSVAVQIESSLNALRMNQNFDENIQVEKEIKRLNDEADRQFRLLKHKSDTVPVLCPPTRKPSASMFGELRFKSIRFEPISTEIISTSTDECGDISLQSIPHKSPMWTVALTALPFHLSVYSFGKSTMIFGCSSLGVISLHAYVSPVSHDSPRHIRTFALFRDQTRLFVDSFTVFNRFMLLHVHLREPSSSNNNGLLFFFTHDGDLDHEPIHLSYPVRQYLADESRLWAIDASKPTIFSHAQPSLSTEIESVIKKRDDFVGFDIDSDFVPFRLAINLQSLAVLGQDLQQVFIYNKMTGERTFTSRFAAGIGMNIRDIGLFPHDDSLLLKFDWSRSDRGGKRSLAIHFDTQNRSVGRIEGKDCLAIAIGPNNELFMGFNLKTGVMRCYK